MPKKVFLLFAAISSLSISTGGQDYDPCCSFPCQNVGVCVSDGRFYQCDCSGTGYYGEQCQIPEIATRIKKLLKPSKPALYNLLVNYKWLWNVVNSISALRRYLMKTVLFIKIGPIADPPLYIGYGSYPTWETYVNKSMYARSLPPIPKNCPTPMGVKGRPTLPDAEVIAEKLLARRKFIPCPERTSVLFPLFAQHFTHQFLKTKYPEGLPHQIGDHSLDLSHVYGDSLERQHALRSHVDGKMKMSVINSEEFPPRVSEANVSMFGATKVPESYRFAFGHQGFIIAPTFLVFGTLWLREHNRVCEILKRHHQTWDDERLFQTARLIVTGVMIKVVIEDYIQHMSGFNFKLLFDPTLLHGQTFSYNNRIHLEFQLLYRWHALVPDFFRIAGHDVSVRSLLFNQTSFAEFGMKTLFESFTRQIAGRVMGGKNQGRDTLAVHTQGIKDSRKMRLQPLNQYRIKFGMEPLRSFAELTDNKEIADELEKMYGHIDAVEFVVGLYLQGPRPGSMFADTMAEIGSPYSLKGLYGNPISSPGWWKPSTFGGKVGMDIIQTSNFQDLVCRNVAGCPKVSFKVPDDVSFDPQQVKPKPKNETNLADILIYVMRFGHVSLPPSDAKEKTPAKPTADQKETEASRKTSDHKTEL